MRGPSTTFGFADKATEGHEVCWKAALRFELVLVYVSFFLQAIYHGTLIGDRCFSIFALNGEHISFLYLLLQDRFLQ